jgi:Spy/CpxP family protein refolding chaperone
MTVPSNRTASGFAVPVEADLEIRLRAGGDMGRFRSLTAAVAVVGLIATGMVTFAQGQRGGPGRGRGDGFGPGGLGIPLRQLNLTEAQRTQLEQIREQHRGDIEAAMKKLAAARQTQRASIESVPADEAKITSLTQDLTQAEVDVAIQSARLNTAVWGVLTDAQRSQLTKLRAERQSKSGGRHERANQPRN